MYETLLVERLSPQVLLVKFNRPEAANALNTQMGHDVRAVFEGLAAAPGETRCVVLTGAGDKAFCAGGDLKERNGMTDEAWGAQHLVFEQAFEALRQCPTPVIAAVNGAAYGGGCEFALACDFIYAAANARFAQTETKLGIMPGCGGTQNLARAVGARRAKELILSARPFSAEEAFDWGLVNRICASETLLQDAAATAAEIAANGPIAVRQAKRAISLGADLELERALALELECYNVTIGTNDRREGVAAFNARRAPQFTGH